MQWCTVVQSPLYHFWWSGTQCFKAAELKHITTKIIRKKLRNIAFNIHTLTRNVASNKCYTVFFPLVYISTESTFSLKGLKRTCRAPPIGKTVETFYYNEWYKIKVNMTLRFLHDKPSAILSYE